MRIYIYIYIHVYLYVLHVYAFMILYVQMLTLCLRKISDIHMSCLRILVSLLFVLYWPFVCVLCHVTGCIIGNMVLVQLYVCYVMIMCCITTYHVCIIIMISYCPGRFPEVVFS